MHSKHGLDFKVCPDCGEYKWCRRIFDKNTGRTFSTYCGPCANERVKKAQKVVMTDVWWCCSFCGKDFHPIRRQMQRRRLRGPQANLKPYCSTECANNGHRTYPTLAEHPTCLAPVPGGCVKPRAIKPNGSAYWLCEAHRKRVERGVRIDTPIRFHRTKASPAEAEAVGR